MIIDTHKEVENLISVGLEKKIAEAIISVYTKKEDELATKTDLQLLRGDMKVLENNLKAEMKTLEARFDGLEAKFDSFKGQFDMLKTINFLIFGALVANFIATLYK